MRFLKYFLFDCTLVCILLTIMELKFVEAKQGMESLSSYDDTDYSSDSIYKEEKEKNSSKPEQLELNGKIQKSMLLVAVETAHQKDLVCSPLTVLFSLAKLAMGATGQAMKELLPAIGIKKESQMKSKFRGIIERLKELPGVKLNVVNRIFASEEYKVLSKFQKKAKKIFKSGIESADFKDPRRVATRVNSWLSKQTDGKISSILTAKDIKPDTCLVVLTAIHFEGEWMFPFKKVEEDEFFSPHGSKKVDMMSIKRFYNYAMSSPLNAKVLEIPYKGWKASFLIVLPVVHKGLSGLIKKLKQNPHYLNTAISNMRPMFVELTVPRFKIETELNLENLLKEIKVNKIFNELSSDLTEIVKKRKAKDRTKKTEVYVSVLRQKVIIEVDKTGTKASAADVMVINPVMAALHNVIFKANHPFIFYVKANKQQLFAGIFTGQN